MKRNIFGRVLVLTTACTLTLPLMASSIYTYTGNDFTSISSPGGGYTTSDFVTGSFTIASPLAPNLVEGTTGDFTPTAYSFTDGVQTFTNAAPPNDFVTFEVSTDASGVITKWFVFLEGGGSADNTIGTSNNGTNDIHDNGDIDFDQFGGQNVNDAGTWSSNVSSAPEPGSLALLGFGMVSLACVVRRRTVKGEAPPTSEAIIGTLK